MGIFIITLVKVKEIFIITLVKYGNIYHHLGEVWEYLSSPW